MSGLALLARAAGYLVTGTDREESPTLAALRDAGIDARAGARARPRSPGGARAVVASTAIGDDNPEVAEARRRHPAGEPPLPSCSPS